MGANKLNTGSSENGAVCLHDTVASASSHPLRLQLHPARSHQPIANNQLLRKNLHGCLSQVETQQRCWLYCSSSTNKTPPVVFHSVCVGATAFFLGRPRLRFGGVGAAAAATAAGGGSEPGTDDGVRASFVVSFVFARTLATRALPPFAATRPPPLRLPASR